MNKSLDLGGGAPWCSGFIHPIKSIWHEVTEDQIPNGDILRRHLNYAESATFKAVQIKYELDIDYFDINNIKEEARRNSCICQSSV